jgi:GTPase SAR1 family protein
LDPSPDSQYGVFRFQGVGLSEEQQQQQQSYRQNFIDSLRQELVAIVEAKLSPMALKYGYTTSPLEDKVKWSPIVLILGNYSSGKSTLINELLGVDVQKTGQAPTDDSFTVITYGDRADQWQERDGMVLLNDPQYPFQHMKHHGQRFAAHFRLKQVRAPLLESLSIIDTPGMLDSVSERDRGYEYQQVVAELATIADLILILFDPHKAGTVRETYESLRQTLPRSTFEDRLRFVLNRVDECANINDLLRVYGTLCWNLSQMTGRKDIPPIYLTYSEEQGRPHPPQFLSLITNQRNELRQAIEDAPKHRLDHLATFIETHGERLRHLLEALQVYGRERRLMSAKLLGLGGFFALLCGGISYWVFLEVGALSSMQPEFVPVLGGIVALLTGLLWFAFLQPFLMRRFHLSRLADAGRLTRLDNQGRRESWDVVEPVLKAFLEEQNGRFSLYAVQRDLRDISRACEKSSREARAALNELSQLSTDQ